MRATYREIPGHLARHEDFDGNSMSARMGRAGTYTVYSYRTPIATVRHGEVWISENHWGPTSGRHINLCKANLR